MRFNRKHFLLFSGLLALLALTASCSGRRDGLSPPVTTTAPAIVKPHPNKIEHGFEQLSEIAEYVQCWKREGHSDRRLSLATLISDHTIPIDWLSNGVLINPWVGPVGIEVHPEKTDSYFILYSKIPNEECVKLSMRAMERFEVRVGAWTNVAATEEQARQMCTTGDMWFIPR